MSNMIDLVRDKIDEYGINIFKEGVAEEGQYTFYCTGMVVFVFPNDFVSVAFQATTNPDDAATDILILKEIPGIEISIMESFIYCKDNKLICGEDAYDLIRETIKAEGASDYIREETYTHLLENMNCFEC